MAAELAALGAHAVHICVDMQRVFAEDTEWHTPWMARVLPNIRQIAEKHAEETIFTRFITARRAGEGAGTWKRYYERWASVTLERAEPLMALVPELNALVPPGLIYDKHAYSPWLGDLNLILCERHADTLLVTGGETEVCVLATVLGGVDHGYRTIVVTDALCSTADETHDAAIDLYHRRYGMQVETATTAEVLAAWH